MPNYKSKMLTFLSIGEMTGLLLDNTDEDGILFAVATDATNFKIVMWRKNSTATVDNENVYPANGPGRWHVLANGSLAKLADVNVLNPTTGQALVYNGTKWVNQTIGGGGGDIFQYGTSLPPSPQDGKTFFVLQKAEEDLSGTITLRGILYSWDETNGIWRIISCPPHAKYGGSSHPTHAPDYPGQILVLDTGTVNTIYIHDGNAWVEIINDSEPKPLASLSDVSNDIFSNYIPGYILRLDSNGEIWNAMPFRLDALEDVSVSNIDSGHILMVDPSGSGQIINRQMVPLVTDLTWETAFAGALIVLKRENPVRFLTYIGDGSNWNLLTASNVSETPDAGTNFVFGGTTFYGEVAGQIYENLTTGDTFMWNNANNQWMLISLTPAV